MVPRVRLEPVPREDLPVPLFSATFRSVGKFAIVAYLARHDDEKPRPLVVTSHGYAGEVALPYIRRLAHTGANVIGVDVRGFGRSRGEIELASDGYLLTGYRAPEHSILRGAVADYLVAHRAALSVLPAPPSRTTFSGFSFAGGLACIAQSASQRADLLAVGVPTFGWTSRRLEICRSGSGQELRRFVTEHPKQAEQALRTMSYFDVVNHAPRITGDVIVGVGLKDDVVPTETVFAIVNNMNVEPKVLEYPCSHSDAPEERLWERFDEYWLAQANRVV